MKNITLDIINEEHISRNIPNAVLLILYIFIGSLGNIAVLIVYTRDMKNVFTSGRLFIPFLALSDLVTLLYNGSVEFSTELQPFWATTDYETVCKVNMFIGLVLVVISGCLYFAIAVHRYVLICKPHHGSPSRRVKVLILIVIGLFVLGTSVPKFIFSGLTKVVIKSERISNITTVAYLCGTAEGFENTLSSNVYNYILTVNSFIWNFSLAIMYIFVAKRIHQRSKESSTLKANTKEDESVSMSSESVRSNPGINARPRPKLVKQITARSITTFITNNRLSWMFILMTILNAVCFTPKLVLDILYSMDRYFFLNKDELLYSVLHFFDNIFILNNVINPFIYGFFDREFRHLFKKRFCFCFK